VKYPKWSCFGCIDQTLSAETRQRILEATAERRALLLPGHFMAPHAGYVEHGKEGAFTFRFIEASDASQ
jgi:hypothetical protein